MGGKSPPAYGREEIRSIRRGVALGTLRISARHSLASAPDLAPLLAASPRTPRSLLRRLAATYPLYVAQNPKAYGDPRLARAILQILEGIEPHRFSQPGTLERKALAVAASQIQRIPKRYRQRILRLASENGVRFPPLPLALADP